MSFFQFVALIALFAFAGRFAYTTYQHRSTKALGDNPFRVGTFEYVSWIVAVSASLLAVAAD